MTLIKKFLKKEKFQKAKKTKYKTINVYMVQKPWKENEKKQMESSLSNKKQRKIEEST